MSGDDVVAERERLAGVVAGKTGLPVLGLTWGTDGTWSARFWLRVDRHKYEIRWATTVRSVGKKLRISYHPELRPKPKLPEAQAATISVWGAQAQEDLVRTHVGIVGLGSVGSIVAEALSRTGVRRLTLMDHDRIELRNLDRTLGAGTKDVGLTKVAVSDRLVQFSHTSQVFSVEKVEHSLLTQEGIAAALDCDVLISCVDRALPRSILNIIAYSHEIPLIDGGIIARVSEAGTVLHVDWRIHTVGPSRACLYCINALRRSDVALDRDGQLDDPDYVKGLPAVERERYGRRNVFAFSLSVAAHEVLHLVALVTGNLRVGDIGNQTYHAFPGIMETEETMQCNADCDIEPLAGSAVSLTPHIAR